jgi:2-polyprenyl-6-methoxyphenol hydroxylase-like FAD-dependent oxidoreductase
MTRCIETDVLIVGAGPCGLMLSNELGPRRVRTLVIDAKGGTAYNPQANATQARTMEHYRRLGFADEIRALGLPVDYPTDIAYFTRFATHELARFSLPARLKITARISRRRLRMRLARSRSVRAILSARTEPARRCAASSDLAGWATPRSSAISWAGACLRST